MPVVCPSCDVEPPRDATAGVPCASCGTALVSVKAGEDLTGTVIDGRFKITARLGKGGMGIVYRAVQRSIGREVALKVIDRRFEDDVVAVKRFLREAKLASALVHPNTVGVIEFGQSAEGRLYLAMELVRGNTLLDVAKGGLPLARIVRIGVQLCDALEAAHALSIVHRDLKLENVMVLDGARDHVKVLDFGLARSLVEIDTRATATGIIAGTPRYLPPEVALGGADAAPSQDMYSLGVLLGELATGAPLWDAPTLEALFTAKMHGQPKLDSVPAKLRALIEKLLDADPDARPNAAATRDALLALDKSPAIGLEATHAAIAVEPSAAKRALSSSAFAPPGPSGSGRADHPLAEPAADPLELEPEWQQEKAEKQSMANRPPPKRNLKIWGIVIAVAMIAIVATVVVIIAMQPAEPGPPKREARQMPPTANTVSIEVRTNRPSEITFNGHKGGRAPSTLHVPKSTTPMEIGVTLMGHPMTKQVIPDRDQVVTFSYP